MIGRSLPYERTESLDFSIRANHCLSPLVSKNSEQNGFTVPAEAGSPSEDEAEQGADQNEDLVKHGRVGPLDRSMDIVLP